MKYSAFNMTAVPGTEQGTKKEQKLFFRHIVARYKQILDREKELEEVTLQEIVLQIGCLSWFRRNDLFQKDVSDPEQIQHLIHLYSGRKEDRTVPEFLAPAAAQLSLFLPDKERSGGVLCEQDLNFLLLLFESEAVFPADPCECGRYFGRLLKYLLSAGRQNLSGRKKTGSFYTPESVVSWTIQKNKLVLRYLQNRTEIVLK